MDTRTRRHQLPDHGFTVIRWAHDLARGRGATSVEPDVEVVRHPDGALVFDDIDGYRSLDDGPLSVLRELLDLEALTVRSWAKGGFARFHKRAGARRAEAVCRSAGSEAAVDWVLANATALISVDDLRDALGPRLFTAGGRDEEYYRRQVGHCLAERRRRRLQRD